MKINFTKPHRLLSRTVQVLSVAGMTGLLYAGVLQTQSAAPALLTIEPEVMATEKETKKAEHKSPSAKKERESETSSEFESDTEHKIVPYPESAPYAEYTLTLPYLGTDYLSLIQLQPNYLPNLIELTLSWDQLESELKQMLDSYSGEWSVYIKDLSNSSVISIHDQPMESASLIKLYIMGAIMEQINNGDLESTDKINSLLEEMITVSDNEAANELVRYLGEDHNHEDGMDVVNSFAKRHGFTSTEQVNGLEDSSLRSHPDKSNQTSTKDCGELLSEIYDGKLVSHLASRKMENLLLGQEINYKIPAALPSEAISASKTGEIDSAENDTAIIYSPGGDFILCIMSSDWESGNLAIDHIRDITKMVYWHFNPMKIHQYSDETEEE